MRFNHANMNKGAFFIEKKDDIYPELLRQIYKGPTHLWYRGKLETLNKTCIAVVGTRRPSPYGEEMTQKIIKELSIWDIAIVSGLAKGIDTIAHETALKEGLKTIAVLGSGINNIYPSQNKKLAAEIETNGLILSEYKDQDLPIDFHFVERNRIISGLSIATLVIEAPIKSGALITANYALEQNRDIFVVPGDIDRPQAFGTLALLQKGGAYPISSGMEIIDCLKKQPPIMPTLATSPRPCHAPAKPQISLNLTSIQKQIVKNLSRRRGTSLDLLYSSTNIDIQNLLSETSFLEIQGVIKVNDGKYFLNVN